VPTRDDIQADCVKALVDGKNAGLKSMLFRQPTGVGKAQPLNAPVLSPTGWTTMGDLQPGSWVVGSDGKPTMVLKVFDRGDLDVYRVVFNDGASVECCGDHLWKVKDRMIDVRRLTSRGGWRIHSTSFLREKLVGRDDHFRFSIPMVKPVEFLPVSHVLDPYLLGVLLGDGSLRPKSVTLTSADQEILDVIEALLPEKVRLVAHGNQSLAYGLTTADGVNNAVLNEMRALGLAGRRSWEKFIPPEYKFSGPEDRLALLQGLLDTDGYSKEHVVEYATTSDELAEDVRFLVESLGGALSDRVRVTNCVVNGERRPGRPSHRMVIRLPAPINPFRLSRKANRYRPRTKYQPRRAIVAIEPIGRMPCRCISVSAPDNLYVADRFVVTHNSRTAVKYIARGLQEWQGRFLITAHLGELLDQFGDELDYAGIPYCVEKSAQHALAKMIRIPSIRVCVGSKDSLQDRRSKRLSLWPKDFFTDVFADEAHLSTAQSFRNVFAHFDSATRIGMTATIDRLDGVPLSTVYEAMVYDYPIIQAIENGHRLPYKAVACDVDVDIRGLKPARSGEFAPGELQSRMAPLLGRLANAIRQELGAWKIRKAIAFLPSVQSAIDLAQACCAVGLPARAVYSSSPDHPISDQMRSAIIEQHKRGEFPLLCNDKLLAMGYNDPEVEAVIHLKPTTSRSLFDQCSGRAGRVHGDKKWAYLFYFGWVSDLSLVGPSDIFAEGLDQRTREIARRIMRKQKVMDPQEVMEQAKLVREMEVEREGEDRERKLRAQLKREEMQYSRRVFDPLGAAFKHTAQNPFQADDPASAHQPVTAAQAAVLSDLGIRDTSGLSKATAGTVIDHYLERQFRRMASVEQVALLTRMRVPEEKAVAMTSTQARDMFLRIRRQYAGRRA
jgi:superfamily II DNA or RNA helicase